MELALDSPLTCLLLCTGALLKLGSPVHLKHDHTTDSMDFTLAITSHDVLVRSVRGALLCELTSSTNDVACVAA